MWEISEIRCGKYQRLGIIIILIVSSIVIFHREVGFNKIIEVGNNTFQEVINGINNIKIK